ncbi:4-(cytidine 5'-diphospho)-2-C-methyl-D-erythritol kinase [Spirulina sp. CS-785/01]|uniref:4-(cytidine 5'-diphospho)-2-C-methyl-D-erythritol kinase n=1 Tax=Spirulina sp. CS-785/01 TaxID=3021716 RepID=UPI00232EF638|nr:4-(cytidine 5'-diphospho)-2-C-methyl-D-erythritol kinase [Spirulina sp. CS-785/01]MDB9313706.1 4-(cytidine 5'-diphospho)-2-C-methyl-D-erythritol kinase [Spirulina sp. CS-785/01]
MKQYSLLAPAKINLYLEIVGDRSDGFHELVMILQSIDLADRVEIKPAGRQTIHLHCNHSHLSDPQTNLAYRAAAFMRDRYLDQFNHHGGVDITLEKNIPIAAGLAGGSADAAAVLVGLNSLWELGLTQPELQDLAAELGSDVPFCVAGGTAIATGRGEQLDFIRGYSGMWVVLGKHKSLEVSTPWAYTTYRHQFGKTYKEPEEFSDQVKRVESGELVEAIAKENSNAIAQHLHNDLEEVVLPAYPEVAKLREAFKQSNALGTMMSGSGPTVFGLCESQKQAQTVKKQVAEQMADPDLQLWVTSFVSQGIAVGT